MSEMTRKQAETLFVKHDTSNPTMPYPRHVLRVDAIDAIIAAHAQGYAAGRESLAHVLNSIVPLLIPVSDGAYNSFDEWEYGFNEACNEITIAIEAALKEIKK